MVKKKKSSALELLDISSSHMPYQTVNRWRGRENVTDRNESSQSVTQALFALAASAR